MFDPRYQKGFMLGIALFAIQQFAGINALVGGVQRGDCTWIRCTVGRPRC